MHKLHSFFWKAQWRDVRVVEGARLESVCTGNCTAGSNPALSAIFLSKIIDCKIERWEMGLAQRGPVNLVRSGRKQR